MAKITALPLAGPLDGTEDVPIVQGGQTRRINPADHLAYIALGAELARDQAADLVLPQNIFVDVDLAEAEAEVEEGTVFKVIDTSTGMADVRIRSAAGSDLLYQEATAAALAAPFASGNLGHDDGGDNAVPSTVGWHLRQMPIDPRSYGAVLDGVADDAIPLRRCFAAAAATGRSVRIPKGKTLLFTDQSTFDSGVDLIPPAGVEIFGEGPTSVLKFKRVAYSSAYGLAIRNENFTLRNLTCVVDINGGTGFAASIAFTGNTRNFTAIDVAFTGLIEPVLAVPSGQYAVLNWFADMENISFIRCGFRYLDFGWVKTSSDPSTQSNFLATDCRSEYCHEVFEFNSPGLFNAVATLDSAVLEDIDTGTTRLSVGQKIKSPGLPLGTTILSVDGPDQITVSAAATANGLQRFSVGTMTNIRIKGLHAQHILQWAIGVANCRDVEIEGHFENIAYEAVHLEDHTENVSVRLSGSGCNSEPGVPTSPGSNNGAVQVMSGCRRVSVEFRDFDLRRSPGGSPNALVVQPIIGNVAGSTNELAASSRILVSGRIVGQAGCQAIVAFDTDVAFLGLIADSPDPLSKISPVTTLKNCAWSGQIEVHNPGTIVAVNDGSLGQWSEILLTTMEDGFPDLIWASGFFGAARNAPPLTSRVTFLLPTTADPGAVPCDLCPAPQTLFGTVSRKYVGPHHAYEAGALNINGGELTPTDVYVEQVTLNLTPGSGVPRQTDDGWDIEDGRLRFRAYADPAIDCQARITLTGDLFPAV